MPSGADVQKDDALDTNASHSGAASGDTAVNSPPDTRPGTGSAAETDPAPAATQDDVELRSPVLPESAQDPSLFADNYSAASRFDAGVSAVSLRANEQQVSSVSALQQEHQWSIDTADAVLDVDGLDSFSSSPALQPVKTEKDADHESPPFEDSGLLAATLSELEDVAAVDEQPAAQSLAAEETEQEQATDPPGFAASGLPNSPAGSPDVLSALGSVGSGASLSALSLGADSMEEPELDQLSLGGLDDAASSPADDFLATDVSAKATIASAADETGEPVLDASDTHAEGLSDSEIDFGAAGELSDPQLASALQPPASAEEVQPAAALEPPPPAPIIVNVGHKTLSEAAEAAADPEPVIPDIFGGPATEAQPFSGQAANDVADAADALDKHADARPWEAALAAAEAVEAELLQGEV